MKRSYASLVFLFLFAALINFHPLAFAGGEQADNKQLHAESSERLIAIMRNMFSIVHEEGISEDKNLSESQLADMVEAVEELLFYAEIMSSRIPETELEENEAVIFRAMAGQLYDEALNVQQIANNYDFNVVDTTQNRLLNEAYVRLERTCAACHQLFRDKDTNQN